MQFSDANLQQALASGLASVDIATKAQADNLRIEECVSDKRRIFFETEPDVPSADDREALKRRHIDYVRNYLWVSNDAQPHTLLSDFEPNSIEIDEASEIVRMESLTWPLSLDGRFFKDFSAAFAEKNTAEIEIFLNNWNAVRDNRPQFATLFSEISNELSAENWEEAVRDRLGLARYSPNGAPEPVALFKYPVSAVLMEAKTPHQFTMPTVLDSEPWEYYFPAPKALCYGRAMALTPCDGDEQLKVEILHSKFTYKPEHLWKVGEIRAPIPDNDLADLRARHLLALQVASGIEDYGT